MARGFESKDVEYQQAEAERTRSRAAAPTAAEREAASQRRTLQLSLARVEADRRAATAPVHCRMLDEAIAALRQRLDELHDER